MTIRRWGLTGCWVLLMLLTGSCTLTDDRDECCRELVLHYHETVDGTDRYAQDIHTIRHLLYDAEGRLLREVYADPSQPQDVVLSELAPGDYSVLTVGNATDKTLFDNLDDLSLTCLTLHTWQQATRASGDGNADGDADGGDGYYDNSDELFWHLVTFTFPEGRQRMDCPLTNIHCHLHVTVSWEKEPPQRGRWTLRLHGAPRRIHTGRADYLLGGLQHPPVDETATAREHRIGVTMVNDELEGEFITLRWTDLLIPDLEVWCNDVLASPTVRLSRVFSEWHWVPSLTLAHDFWITVVIRADGSADVLARGRLGVADWVDGGTIGG